MKAINKTALFLILTFVISFSLAGIYTLVGYDGTDKIPFLVLGVIYMFIPAISVVIVKKFIHHEELKKELLISFKINKWLFVAWLLMPVVVLLTIGISLLFPDVSYSPEMSGLIKRFEPMMTPEQLGEMKKSMETLPDNLIWLMLLQGLLAGVTINAVAAFGEELGWRGFLLNEFKNMNFLRASTLIGLIWGIWHAPLILMGHNYPQHPQTGVLMMIVLCILLTPLFMYITIKSRSVIGASILHGTMNAIAGMTIMVIDGGNELTVGITGLAGFIALLIFVSGFAVYDIFISKDRVFISKINDSLKD